MRAPLCSAFHAARLLPLLLCLAAVLAAGCEARVPPEAEGHDIVRPHLGFAIDLAEGWTFRDLYGDVVLEIYPQGPAPSGPGEAAAAGADARRPAERRSLAVVHVAVIDREGMSLDEWADRAISDSRELQPSLEEVSRRPTQLSDGREALALELRNPRGVQPVVQRMLLAMTARRAYAVLASAPESDIAAADGPVKECFTSFIVW